MLPPAPGFGILLFLQAVLAQSAPQIPPDEEAIIDALAAMQESYRDVPAPQFSNDDVMEILNSLQSSFQGRQFAYTPKDPRFYLAREDFPEVPPPKQQQQLPEGRYYKSELDVGNPGNGEVGSLDFYPDNNGIIPENQPGFHYMKKSELERESDAGGEFSRLSPRGGDVDQRAEANSDQGSARTAADTKADAMKKQAGYITHPILQTPNHVMVSHQGASIPSVRTSPVDQASNGFFSSFYYIAIIAGCSAAAVVGVVAAGICWYRIHERVKAAADVDYPAYGVTGPSKDKQQMAALQKTAIQEDRQGSGGSDVESEDDNEDGDYTVYECPGLAGLCNTGEMEVKNPLYDDEPTPATPQVAPSSEVPEAAQE